jgi:hypothetical protein
MKPSSAHGKTPEHGPSSLSAGPSSRWPPLPPRFIVHDRTRRGPFSVNAEHPFGGSWGEREVLNSETSRLVVD